MFGNPTISPLGGLMLPISGSTSPITVTRVPETGGPITTKGTPRKSRWWDTDDARSVGRWTLNEILTPVTRNLVNRLSGIGNQSNAGEIGTPTGQVSKAPLGAPNTAVVAYPVQRTPISQNTLLIIGGVVMVGLFLVAAKD